MNNIAFIGAGNMNQAIIAGLVGQNYPAANIAVSNPSPEKLNQLAQTYGVKTCSDNCAIAKDADVIMLGVKPHLIEQVTRQLASEIELKGKMVISLAAGIPLSGLEKNLGSDTAVVRCMPNTPSQLGLGMSGLCANDKVSQQQKQAAEQIMQAVGQTLWVSGDEQIDAVTAISGSGPAYFYLFMEAMQQQAESFGFEPHQARQLVQQTALGAANMAVQQSDLSIQELRQRVTSKGGTTAAAINSFESANIHTIVEQAMQSAFNRAQQLSALGS